MFWGGGGGVGGGVFFFNDTATTEIYTLSLHDALPILFLIKLVRRILVRFTSPLFRLHLSGGTPLEAYGYR